jgi:Mg-chelatase subunit ChlD
MNKMNSFLINMESGHRFDDWLNNDRDNKISPDKPPSLREGTAATTATMLVLDVSWSMEESDFKPTRLGGAKKAAKGFLDAARRNNPNQLVGVTSFSGRAREEASPTVVGREYSALKRALDGMSCDSSTNIEAGLNLARKAIKRAGAAVNSIVLLTDGEPNEGNAEAAAKRVKSNGIELNIIGIGGSPADVNEPLLKQMASVVDGERRYWFIRNVPDLVKRFEVLGLQAF